MAKHFPMLIEVRAQEVCYVAERHEEVLAGNAVTGRRGEYNSADQMAVWEAGVTVAQQILDDARCLASPTAPKPNQYRAKNSRVPRGIVELCTALLHLANEHVGLADRYIERIIYDIVVLVASLSAPWNDVARMRKTHGENIEVGRGTVCPAIPPRDNRILGDCEISVDPEVCLYKRDSTIHRSHPCGPDGHRVVHVQRSAGTGMRE